MEIPNLNIYDNMPDHTKLTAKDVIKAFDCYGDTLDLMANGEIPFPSKEKYKPRRSKRFGNNYIIPPKGGRTRRVSFWLLGDLRKIKNELEAQL